MKILHVLPSLGIGGTEKSVLELCRGLGARGFENRVVALKSGGETESRLRAAGVQVELLNGPDGFVPGVLHLPALFLKLKRSISDNPPHVVHTWLTRANAVGRLAARAAGVENVVSSLRVMEREKGYHLWAERRTARWARTVTVNSTALFDFAVNEIGLPREKVLLIFNGIDLSAKLPSASDAARFRTKWVPSGKKVVGAVGRLHVEKGFDVFLRAAQRVLKEVSEAHFLIAGDGPERGSLETLARSLGISDSVTFCGWVKDSSEFLACLDVYALPSRWEGMPNAAMEAMLLAKPVAATRVAGIPDLIEQKKEGLIVEPEDSSSLAEALLRLLKDPEWAGRLAEAARRKVSERFDLRRTLDAYETLYRSFER